MHILFNLLAILTLDPLVESSSEKFYTFFVSYNEVLIGHKLPENRISSKYVTSRVPYGQPVSRGCLLTHILRNAIIWKFMTVKTFLM